LNSGAQFTATSARPLMQVAIRTSAPIAPVSVGAR